MLLAVVVLSCSSESIEIGMTNNEVKEMLGNPKTIIEKEGVPDVYTNKMIPAKILEQLVESKEFRKLIPKKYLSEEIKINGLLKGQIVKFKNTDIKNILILWSLGRLCPVQKAWKVKAEK